METRPFQIPDLEEVYELERLSFTDPYPWWLLSELARKNPETFLVITVDDHIVGYAVIDKWNEDHHYHLVSIAVHPRERQKGFATAMLQGLEDKLESGKILRLEVRERNNTAIQFYEKHKFIKTGKIPEYYADGETAIVMEKRTTRE